jgi:excisionase family DNA binding protein
MESKTPKLLVVAREAAEALAISERTLWALTASGQITAIRIGRAVRYSPEDLADYVRRARGEPPPAPRLAKAG